MKYAISVIILLSLALSGCYYDVESELYPNSGNQNCDTVNFSYASRIEPIIKLNCYECHSASANLGNVNLEGYNQLKIYADNGSLTGAINHNAGFSAMPKNRGKLPVCDISAIEMWISKGNPQ